MTERGLLIVLSGPSGVGKGTVRKAIFDNYNNDFDYSVSMTTRKQREGEIDGVDYYFRTKEQFEYLIQKDGLLEYAEYVGNYYGTPLEYVNKTLDQGRDVFLEIEVQGALKVREKMPEGIFVFLSPPDLEELNSRIVNRGTDTQEMIEKRMTKAVEELKLIQYYDYVVENDTVNNAARKIRNIIESEHLKVTRNLKEFAEIIEEME
ncbi:guanylate kinase [Marinilactibacillus psychrotolerans]|uniref:Guanylate kinase n=1 Tax=Marinilactibacillus psychrotolerans TaxID=191770 RepID=A0A511GY46_9LACT|nr:guanylate kinase [Marinilactibacillus psychrotolerans]TLQ08529.1 guanylate kinase [Marinilactibacillus psychrotolerans]GEL66186.1 guanylate kinase [Marinilactibacillus psychrotolerans]GEQ34695.1 guanylate kinase [Marinilactibacillus psychrotolerans]SDB95302.1 guanylate kinase [Marinilactibacillus psychrotolerans]